MSTSLSVRICEDRKSCKDNHRTEAAFTAPVFEDVTEAFLKRKTNED